MGFLQYLRRHKALTNQADKLKLWCVRRWLHLVPINELTNIHQQRILEENIAAFYTKMTNSMMEHYAIPTEDVYLQLDADTKGNDLATEGYTPPHGDLEAHPQTKAHTSKGGLG